MNKEAMKLAKAFIEDTAKYLPTAYDGAGIYVVKTLEEALAKQEQGEPAAHINQNGVIHEAGYPWGIHNILEPLYRHSSQQRKPLTDEHIWSIHDGYPSPTEFARAIEAAHGIKE
jgi:hypothetical protein